MLAQVADIDKRPLADVDKVCFESHADLITSVQTRRGLRPDHPSSSVSIRTDATSLHASSPDEVPRPVCLLATPTNCKPHPKQEARFKLVFPQKNFPRFSFP